MGRLRRHSQGVSVALAFVCALASTVGTAQASAFSPTDLGSAPAPVTPTVRTREVKLDGLGEGRLVAALYDWRRDEFVFLQHRASGTDLIFVEPSGAESRRKAAPDVSEGLLYDYTKDRYVLLDSAGGAVTVFDPASTSFDPSADVSERLLAERGKSTIDEVPGDMDIEQGERLLDVDPYSGDLYVFSPDTSTISVYSPSGQIKDQQTVLLGEPIDLFLAPTSDATDEPEETTVFMLSDSGQETTLFEVIEEGEMMAMTAAVSVPSSFTTDWITPSPDPMGLLLDAAGSELTIVDSEVNEIPSLWLGWNVFVSTPGGGLVDTSATTSFSNEPTGLTVDLETGLFYVTDDSADEVFIVNPGLDGQIGGGDDSVTSFDTRAFLSSDPEGVTFAPDLQALFIADAANREIYRIDAGPNGLFEGSASDDTITSFDTAALGLAEPEGIAYLEETSSLLIVSQNDAAEVTVSGSLVRLLDLSGFSPIQLSGVDASAYDPIAGGWHVFVSDRAIDNNVDPNENDGRILSFLLAPANDAPDAVTDQAAVTSGGTVTIQVLANDTDPDGNLDPDSLAIDCPSCQLPEFGHVTLNGDGTLDYTSTVTGVSSDLFSYEVCDTGFDNDPTTDENDLCDVASVAIVIVGTSPPQAVDDAASTPEDTTVSIDVIGNDFDADNDLDPGTLDVTCSGCATPSLGTVSVVGDQVSFVPASDQWGADSFEYEICDAAGLCDRALVRVDITPVADAPTAADDSFSTTANTVATLDPLANDKDPDGDLVATSLNLDCGDCYGPAHGIAIINGDGTLTYEPATNYIGPDALSYEVCDSTSRCSGAVVSITVFDNQPVTFSVIGDVPYSIAEISEFQGHLDDHNLYSPSAFFVHLGDIKSGSSPCVPSWYADVASQMSGLAVPTFIVPGDNEWADCDDPELAWQYWTENFLAFDAQFCGSPQVWRQSIRPENFAFIQGGVLFIGINLIRGFVAAGEETIRLQDDADWISTQVSTHGDSVRSVVVFAQAAPFTEPFASQFEATSANFDKPVLYLQGDGHSWIDDRPFVSTQNIRRIQVERGIAANPPIEVTATTSGPDAFTVDRDPWPSGTQPLNRPPCVQAGADQTVQDAAVLTGLASDDGVPTSSTISTTWSVISGPGVVTFDDANALTTRAQFSLPGSYVLRLEASDGALTTSDSLTVIVTSNTSPPTAVDDSASTNEDTPVVIDVAANDTDPDIDLDPSSVTIVSPAADATVTGNGDGTVTYTPDPDFNGSDSFTYEICDLTSLCATATVTVTVTPVNDPPTAVDDTASTSEDTAVIIGLLANDIDPDGDPLTFVSVSGGSNGTVTDNGDGTVTYTPAPNWFGTDTFTYTATDGTDTSNIATVTVTVNQVNNPPIATDDSATTAEDTAVVINVTTNDTDPDGDPLSIGSIVQPTNGTVTDNGDGTVTYTPNPDFNGSDSFTYTATDGTATSNSATVTVIVIAVSDAPTANEDTATTAQDTVVVIDVAANDTDPDADLDPSSVTIVVPAADATVTGKGDGTVTYTPNPGFNGTDSFTYQICDLTSLCATATVTVTVTAQVPLIQLAESELTQEGRVISGTFTDTFDSDDVREVLSEQETGGPKGKRVSRIDHRWTFTIVPGTDIQFSIEAAVPTVGEQFSVTYSTDGGATFSDFSDPLIISGATESLYVRQLPPSTFGQVVIRLHDTDRTPGSDPEDVVNVDLLEIKTTDPTQVVSEVQIEATAFTVSESEPMATFTLTRSGSLATELYVNVAVSGNALGEVDYVVPPLTVTFAVGVAAVDLDVALIDDSTPEPTKTLILTVVTGVGYQIGDPAAAEVLILDDDSAQRIVLASAETTTHGNLVNSYVDTQASDDVSESITEVVYGGGQRSRLQHTWSFDAGSCISPTFLLEVRHDSTSETFLFSYINETGTTVSLWETPLSPDETAVSIVVPANLTGIVTLQVNDSDQSRGDRTADSLFVDYLAVSCSG